MGGSASKEGGEGGEEKVCTCGNTDGQHESSCPLAQTGGRRRRKSRKRKSRNKRKKSRSKRRKRKRSRRRR